MLMIAEAWGYGMCMHVFVDKLTLVYTEKPEINPSCLPQLLSTRFSRQSLPVNLEFSGF